MKAIYSKSLMRDRKLSTESQKRMSVLMDKPNQKKIESVLRNRGSIQNKVRIHNFADGSQDLSQKVIYDNYDKYSIQKKVKGQRLLSPHGFNEDINDRSMSLIGSNFKNETTEFLMDTESGIARFGPLNEMNM